MIPLDEFISKYVTRRSQSLFEEDLKDLRNQLKKSIQGKSFLVIGGAGSIGSQYIKEVLLYHPSEMIVVDINENALTELTRDLRSSGTYIPQTYLTYPMDYDSDVFRSFLRQHGRFDIVANFSAHKHVRSEKDIYSTEALLYNNIIKLFDFLNLLQAYPPESFFCVSTDKAANPVNIMGASKRIMEDVLFSFSDSFSVKTARFANVAFSNGSLPDGFIHRLEKNQPISAPSDVKRFFVSPKESGQLCMIACMLGGNREIYYPILTEGQMMGFDEIAKSLLSESGYKAVLCDTEKDALDLSKRIKVPHEGYPVVFSASDTTGEKMIEEFYTEDEEIEENRYHSIGVIVNKEYNSKNNVRNLVDELKVVFCNEQKNKEEIISILKKYLPSFNHIERNRNLDQKM